MNVGFCSEVSLKQSDITRVMDQFFSIHVVHDQMSAQVIKRAYRLYIERFDPDKVYKGQPNPTKI